LDTALHSDLASAIDLLWLSASVTGPVSASPALASVADAALQYARSNTHPEWLNSLADDDEFITQLRKQLAADKPSETQPRQPRVEALGPREEWDALREAAGRLAASIPALASSGVLALSRKSLHKMIATFVGDVIVYLHQRDQAGLKAPILTDVLAALEEADEFRKKSPEPLIIIAHSMGGNIVYDILTKFRPELEVDLLVTVGSQPALFEELKLFAVSDPDVPKVPGDRAINPPKVKKWINVFDRNDILSFAASRVFSNVVDRSYSTGTDLFHAHTNYFNRPSFQARLGEHIKEIWMR
jgi:hypothetical protein